jgi:hypothetical protein
MKAARSRRCGRIGRCDSDFAPQEAISSTVAAPMPLAAPVTMATFPANVRSAWFLFISTGLYCD